MLQAEPDIQFLRYAGFSLVAATVGAGIITLALTFGSPQSTVLANNLDALKQPAKAQIASVAIEPSQNN